MPSAVDIEDGLAECVSLWSAETADELHQVLVLHTPVRRTDDAFEPFALLTKHHEREPETSVDTAILLLTDRRWRGGVGKLAHQIAEAGILDEGQLDALAEAFLMADDALYWTVPDDWFSDEAITLEVIGGEDEVEDEQDSEPEEGGPSAVARRDVWPPLRRWAAGRELAGDPAGWGLLLARAKELTARDGAAVMSGVMDRLDVLPPSVQTVLIERARAWPHQGVRRAAFENMAARDGAQAAYLLARDDPNAKIRAWAAALVAPARVAKSNDDRESGGTSTDTGQSMLF